MERVKTIIAHKEMRMYLVLPVIFKGHPRTAPHAPYLSFPSIHHQSTSTCKSASSAILPLFLSLIPTALVRITFSVSLRRRRRRRRCRRHRPEMGSSGAGSPCGACKFLRRKCAADCVFAPYFRTEQGPARFAAIHKVFGASNVAKLLLHVPVAERCEAVFTIAYEAQARLRDPVYGCVSHIFALQQQVVYLQAQLMQVKAQLAQNLMTNSINNSVAMPNPHQQLGGDSSNNNMSGVQAFAANHMMMMSNNSASPTSSLESIDHSNNSNNSNGAMMMVHHEMESNRDDCYNYQELSFMLPPSSCTTKKRPPNCDLSELQALAHTMMRNGS